MIHIYMYMHMYIVILVREHSKYTYTYMLVWINKKIYKNDIRVREYHSSTAVSVCILFLRVCEESQYIGCGNFERATGLG